MIDVKKVEVWINRRNEEYQKRDDPVSRRQLNDLIVAFNRLIEAAMSWDLAHPGMEKILQ